MKKPTDPIGAAWKRWFRSHGEALQRLGLPAEIAQDERRWGHLLGHGYDLQTGWKPDLLPATQQHALLSYIQTHFPDDDLSGLTLLMRRAALLP